MKVYRLNECEWYATNGTLGQLIGWYDKNVDSIDDPDEICDIEECNLETEGMWSDSNVTPDDIKKLGNLDEYCSNPPEFGDLMRQGGEVVKYQSFKDILGNDDIKEPYCIASSYL